MGCLGYEMSRCEMSRIWYAQDVGYLGSGMFRMWNVWYIGCW